MPFESIVLSSINQCMQVLQTQPDSFEAFERRAEYSLLSDFVISTPKIGNKKVSEYIRNIEQQVKNGLTSLDAEKIAETKDKDAKDGTSDEAEGQLTFIPSSDIKDHIKTHKELMPQITGPKAYSLPAPVIRDENDIPDNSAF